MSKEYIYKTAENEKISVSVFGKDSASSCGCLIYAHGFKGFKDWGFIPYIGNYFAEKGFFVITFNFSHNGIDNNPVEITRLDKFAENTLSREVFELNEIIEAYRNKYFSKRGDNKIGLIGHSRGGAIALFTSVLNSYVSAVSTWASIAKIERYSKRQIEQWKKNGFIEIINTRTGQVMKLNISMMTDYLKYKDSLLNIKNAARNLNRPWLIAHATGDMTVPVKEAESLYRWSDKAMTELFIINGAGHTFDVSHPFSGTNDKFEKLLVKTTKFFKENLI